MNPPLKGATFDRKEEQWMVSTLHALFVVYGHHKTLEPKLESKTRVWPFP